MSSPQLGVSQYWVESTLHPVFFYRNSKRGCFFDWKNDAKGLNYCDW